MSQFLVHLGPDGSGTKMKLVINQIMAVQVAALAEGLNLAAKAGLNLDQVVPLLANGGVGSPVVKAKIGRMVKRQYDDPDFAAHLLYKDTIYAHQLADALQAPLPTLTAAQEILRQTSSQGLGGADVAAVIETVRSASV